MFLLIFTWECLRRVTFFARTKKVTKEMRRGTAKGRRLPGMGRDEECEMIVAEDTDMRRGTQWWMQIELKNQFLIAA